MKSEDNPKMFAPKYTKIAETQSANSQTIQNLL